MTLSERIKIAEGAEAVYFVSNFIKNKFCKNFSKNLIIYMCCLMVSKEILKKTKKGKNNFVCRKINER